MNRVLNVGSKSVRRSSLAVAIAALSAAPALAVDGTWTNAAGGSYSDAANWAGGTVAGGADATANFNTVDVTTVAPVTLTSGITLGNLIFGDTDTTSAGGWQVGGLDPASTGGTTPFSITLAGTSPTITVNALAAGSTARIDSILTGAVPLTITGPGTLHLTAGNTYTGNTTLTNGNLRLGAGSVFAPSMLGTIGGATVEAPDLILNGTNTITNGNNASGTMFIGNDIVANAGSNTTFNLGSRSSIGQNNTGTGAIARTVTGSGNLTFNLGSNVSRNDFLSSFVNYTGTVTFTAQQVPNTTNPPDGGVVSPVGRLMANGGNFGAGFTNSNVVMDGFAVLTVRTNSGGNTINFGSLSGTSTTTGFITPEAGGAATLSIGGLNTSTSFAGLFVGNNIVQKVGTGTLTLTSSQFHTNNTNINGGTLKLSGDGNLPTSPVIAMANGTTFDVSSTNATYQTAANQTLQSAAGSTVSIVGPYLHSQGSINPGTLTGAGTMNFGGPLTLNGGALNMELSPTVAVGGTNDLINVAGNVSLGGNLSLNLGLLGGLSTGTYTLLQTSGGGTISGSTAGWAVNFGARGAPPTLSQTATALKLTVSSTNGAPLVWKGTVDGNWNINTTANFLNTLNNQQDKFFQLDTVRFDDTATNYAVALTGALAPTAVVVDNTTDYTFSGTGSIAGTASLTKSGTGKLTISNTSANTYSGGTTLNNGTIDIGTLGQNGIGTGTITLAGGTLRAITPTGGNITLANAINVTGTSTFVTANSATTARQTILGGPITGSGSLSIVSDNNATAKGVDIADTSGFTGTLTVNDGLAVRFSSANNGNAGMNLVINGTGTVGTISSSALVIPLRTLSGTGRLQGHQSGGTGSTVEYVIGASGASSTFDGTLADGAQGATVRPVFLTKAGAGTLTLNGTNTYTGTTAVTGGTLVLGANATTPVLGATSATTTGGADIRGGKLVLSYTAGNSPLATVQSALAAGYAQSPKFATGQFRSTTLSGNHTLGYLDNGSSVTIAYTLPGDADLSLAVGFADLVALAQNYNGTNKVWSQGNFDYDTDVDFNDLVLLAQNYNQAALADVSGFGSDFASDWALAQSLVPEPTSLAAIGGVATLVLRRRRAAIA